MKLTYLPLCVLLLCLVSCFGMPDSLEEEVLKDFKKKYPDHEYVSAGVGEGDLAVAYVHVKFMKNNSDSIFEEVWQYWDLAEGGWTHRDNRKEK